MVQEKKTAGPALIVGALGGTALGVGVAALLMARPAQAAPPEEQLQYLLDLLSTVAEGQAQLIVVLEQWIAAQGGEPGAAPGIEVTVKTPWIAKDPEQIYSHAIRAIGTFTSDVMVSWIEGKRILLKVESSLNQACNIQVLGNYVDNFDTAVNINAPLPCPANTNISIGLAWDDWHPFIGIRITTVVAPTAGILNGWAVIQE